MESKSTMLKCPLCNGIELKEVDQLSSGKIRELWKIWGREFSEEAWKDLPEDRPITLQQCSQCGFSFFEPSLAGGEKFYLELEGQNYYSTGRQEFSRTLNFARENNLKRILDVGCGSGAFLDLAKAVGHEVCGVELNKSAAEKAERKGHVIFEELLDNLDETKTGGCFDLITFFQVLEHVSDPVSVMKRAGSLLRPGGYIAIAVPFADGVYRLVPYDPHQWPPHHVSRWRLIDLQQLATAVRMKLTKFGGDVLLGAQIEQFWNMHNQTASLVGKRGFAGGRLFPKLISLFYRKTGMKYFFPEWGNSIYGYFQKL